MDDMGNPLNQEMIEKSIELMIVGMGTVFLFLVLMYLCMNGMAAFFRKFSHLFPEPAATAPARPAAQDGDNDRILAVAIAAAASKRR
jgi:sodium pump decarboxylase gamma subunit